MTNYSLESARGRAIVKDGRITFDWSEPEPEPEPEDREDRQGGGEDH